MWSKSIWLLVQSQTVLPAFWLLTSSPVLTWRTSTLMTWCGGCKRQVAHYVFRQFYNSYGRACLLSTGEVLVCILQLLCGRMVMTASRSVAGPSPEATNVDLYAGTGLGQLSYDWSGNRLLPLLARFSAAGEFYWHACSLQPRKQAYGLGTGKICAAECQNAQSGIQIHTTSACVHWRSVPFLFICVCIARGKVWCWEGRRNNEGHALPFNHLPYSLPWLASYAIPALCLLSLQPFTASAVCSEWHKTACAAKKYFPELQMVYCNGAYCASFTHVLVVAPQLLL